MGWLLATAAAEFAVMVVTGVYLIFFYRPGATGPVEVVHLGPGG